MRKTRAPITQTALTVLALALGWSILSEAADGPGSRPASRPLTQPFTQPATRGAQLGPDTVVLKELVNLYEPVPFDHKSHAQMAEMWQGCETCHHRPPTTQPTTQAAANHASSEHHTQADAATIPACKSCHLPAAEETNIQMPNLKGAYHRQCLNCHREWMHGNACVVCHKPRDGQVAAAPAATKDDIIGRMHPPIPEPETKAYKTRFTPADGNNVLFRHKEHTAGFGLRCVGCHRNDSCAHCHDPKANTVPLKPIRPGNTWAESHGACMSCHSTDRCGKCHYKDDQPAPPSFSHAAVTGQSMDKDHDKLSCWQCHSQLKVKAAPTCGDVSCHEPSKAIAYPDRRPGAFTPIVRIAATRPALRPIAIPTTRGTTTRPATLPSAVDRGQP